MTQYDRLTALDASFLHMERLEHPMHVGAMSVLEGEPFFDANGHFRIGEVRDLVLSRLPLLPRFRRRLTSVPYDMGRSIWIDDNRFDITYHVRHTALPKPGSWEQLVALTTRIQEGLLDRERPLWELWMVEGLENGHVALLQKTHHSLIDGVSGVDVATLLLDPTPDFVPPELSEWTPAPAPNPSQLLLDSLRERATEPAEFVRSVRSLLRGPRHAIGRASELARSMGTMVSRDSIAPRTSINARTGRHRLLSVVRIPLADVKTIRRALGGTVNDVVLAGVGGGLNRLFTSRGDETDGLRLRVLCPVSVRSDDQRGALGNKVSAIFVSLPVGAAGPRERLSEISAQTADLKEKRQALSADFLLNMSDYVAPTLMSLAARAVHRQPFVNLIVTNVPGPQQPLYMMGARLLEAFPIVPLTQNLTMVVGILSYDGTLHFGLWADRDAAGDLEVLAGGIEDAFAEMMKVATERGDVMTELWERDAWELADDVRAGKLKAVDLLDHFLARVERFNEELNAFCFLDVDRARRDAAEIDAAVARGVDPGVWAGVPMGVKELVAVEGWPDTHASMLYKDAIADHTATEAARLRAAGAVLVGLTTSPEYGSVNWTRTYLHGVTRNPWNPERTPGGSSGGSAAAVSVGMMPICTGSDGGGSIRIPSAYSGLFGFKVSFGRVGSDGNFDSGLTSVPGPMCRSVRDAARYVDAVAGPTDVDPTSLPKPPSYEDALVSGTAAKRLRGLRAAWSSTLGFAVCDPEVEKRGDEAALALAADAGIELVDVDFHLPKPGQAWSILSNIDVSANHLEAFRGSDEPVTPVSRVGFEAIERMTSEQVLRAQQRRWELLRAIADVFDEVDLIFTPTTATTAFKAEGPPPMEIAGQRVGGMGSVPYTAPFNISGMPAVSIPVGTSVDGLPVGLQVVARRHEEELVLACGAIAEANRPWPKFAPMAHA